MRSPPERLSFALPLDGYVCQGVERAGLLGLSIDPGYVYVARHYFHQHQLRRLKAVGTYLGFTGLLSRKSRGLSWKPTHSTGIAGQSSVRGR